MTNIAIEVFPFALSSINNLIQNAKNCFIR